MSQLDKFIEECKSNRNKYTELEFVRYVYIKLGQIMSFNLDFFYGNHKTKDKIYYKNSEKDLINSFEEQTIICKSLSYIFERILNKLNIHTESIVDYNEYETHYHVYNLVCLSDGRKLVVDLQFDLENIQSHQRTRYFGSDIITENELEKIDLNIGYIREDNYYAEDYFYLLRKALSNDISLKQKVKFILQNINSYTDVSGMEYVERRKYYIRFIRKFMDFREMSKIHFIDTFQIKENEKEYRFCIGFNSMKEDSVFVYSNDVNSFEEYSLEEFNKLLQNGLQIIGDVPGVNKYANKDLPKFK